MQATSVRHRLIDRTALLIVVVAFALPVTYLEVTRPSLDEVRSAINHIPWMKERTSSKPATTTPQSAAVAAPVAAPKTTTTTTLVYLRAGKSTTSKKLADVPAGTTIQLRDESDATWQGVTYQGVDGFIYSSYLQH